MIRTDISQSPPEKQLEGPWGVVHCRLHSFDFYIWSFILTEFLGVFFSTWQRRCPCRLCKLLGLERLLGCVVWLVDSPFIKDMHIKHVPRSYFQDGDTKMLWWWCWPGSAGYQPRSRLEEFVAAVWLNKSGLPLVAGRPGRRNERRGVKDCFLGKLEAETFKCLNDSWTYSKKYKTYILKSCLWLSHVSGGKFSPSVYLLPWAQSLWWLKGDTARSFFLLELVPSLL